MLEFGWIDLQGHFNHHGGFSQQYDQTTICRGMGPIRSSIPSNSARGVKLLLGGWPTLGIATAAMLQVAAAAPGLSEANVTALPPPRL